MLLLLSLLAWQRSRQSRHAMEGTEYFAFAFHPAITTVPQLDAKHAERRRLDAAVRGRGFGTRWSVQEWAGGQRIATVTAVWYPWTPFVRCWQRLPLVRRRMAVGAGARACDLQQRTW